LGIVLTLGIYVRYINLDTHFAHADDIGVAISILKANHTGDILTSGKAGHFSGAMNRIGLLGPVTDFLRSHYPYVTVPLHWSYAPLQFVFTPLLISSDQTYRELLFWGRFPSFFFGIAAFGISVLFWRMYRPENYFAHSLLSVTLLAFSWENIIYAQQMESYSIGVFAALCLVVLLGWMFDTGRTSLAHFFALGFALAVICHAQYQLLLYIPGFYLALLTYHYKQDSASIRLPGTERSPIEKPLRKTSRPVRRTLMNIFISGIIFIIFIVPLLVLVTKLTSKSLNWNVGPQGEFLLSIPPGSSSVEKIWYTFSFFLSNFPIVTFSNLSFLPEGPISFLILAPLLTILLIAGAASLVSAENPKIKHLGLYFLASGFVYSYFILRGKLAFSPTRHSLIFMPYMVILLSEGLGWLSGKAAGFLGIKRNSLHTASAVALSLVITVMFLSCFPQMSKSRADKFDEKEINHLLSTYNVKSIVQYDWTWNLRLMDSVSKRYPLFFDFHKTKVSSTDPLRFDDTIAFVSHRSRLEEIRFRETMNSIDMTLMPGGLPLNYSDYRVVYAQEASSDVEIDFSSRTKNGTNGFFFYVLKKKES